MRGESFEMIQGLPSPQEYVQLRAVAGLSPRTVEAAQAGLPNTWFGILIRDGDDLIGMGRVVGDGGLNFELVDIAVDPKCQGLGLGKQIVSALVGHLKSTAPESAYVSLIADGDAQRLYAQFGFEPTAPKSIGMAMRIVR